jgi:hypothetical protein
MTVPAEALNSVIVAQITDNGVAVKKWNQAESLINNFNI